MFKNLELSFGKKRTPIIKESNKEREGNTGPKKGGAGHNPKH